VIKCEKCDKIAKNAIKMQQKCKKCEKCDKNAKNMFQVNPYIRKDCFQVKSNLLTDF
jgi:hypothetical protein